MRDWKRNQQAKDLRNSGLTWREIGEVLGISGMRSQQLIKDYERHQAELVRAGGQEKWGQHLNPGTRAKLERMARELLGHGWKVEPPGAWANPLLLKA